MKVQCTEKQILWTQLIYLDLYILDINHHAFSKEYCSPKLLTYCS